MATIDERAEEFGKQECGENCIFICEEWKDKNGVCSRLASRAALYKEIATEQRAIDEKRIKLLEEDRNAFIAFCHNIINGMYISVVDAAKEQLCYLERNQGGIDMRRTYLTMQYRIILLRLKIINFIRGLIASVMKKL